MPACCQACCWAGCCTGCRCLAALHQQTELQPAARSQAEPAAATGMQHRTGCLATSCLVQAAHDLMARSACRLCSP